MASVDPKQLLLNMQKSEYDTFVNDYLPLLESTQEQMGQTRTNYVNTAQTEAANLQALQANTAENKRETLGITQNAEQAADSNRKSALNLAQTEVKSSNAAIDQADKDNLAIASNLMNVATGIRNQAINNASSASGLASSREQQGAQNKANAAASNASMIGTAASVAAIMF